MKKKNNKNESNNFNKFQTLKDTLCIIDINFINREILT